MIVEALNIGQLAGENHQRVTIQQSRWEAPSLERRQTIAATVTPIATTAPMTM